MGERRPSGRRASRRCEYATTDLGERRPAFDRVPRRCEYANRYTGAGSPSDNRGRESGCPCEVG